MCGAVLRSELLQQAAAECRCFIGYSVFPDAVSISEDDMMAIYNNYRSVVRNC